MVWAKFTNQHLNSFMKLKYLLDDNNILLKYIKDERRNIVQFAKDKSFNIDISTIDSYDKINNYVNNRFVDTKNLLIDMKTLNTIYKIKWDNNLIIIKTHETIDLMRRIKIIVFMIEYLKEKTQNNKKITIFLILSRLEKQFPTNTKIMGVKNANSGYNDSRNDIIFIWRKEEFEKVLFHELMHNFELDKRDEHVHNIINTDGPHLYFEALTDFQGIIYHLIYLSLFTRMKIKNLLEYELGFIRNQAMQLNNLWELGDWKKSPDKIIEQNTAAFSYYILKYLMFEYFLNNVFDSSNNYKTILKNVLENGFIEKEYIEIESSRMTLFQLE